MHKDKHSKIWVPIIVVLVILGLIWFAWWSISNSKKASTDILKSKDKPTTQTTDNQ